MPPAHIQQWLNQALATYAYKDQTSQAAGSALDMFPSLKVKTDQYSPSPLRPSSPSQLSARLSDRETIVADIEPVIFSLSV